MLRAGGARCAAAAAPAAARPAPDAAARRRAAALASAVAQLLHRGSPRGQGGRRGAAARGRRRARAAVAAARGPATGSGLRGLLRACNGLPDLEEYVVPAGHAGAARAAGIFRRCGFVVLRGALDGGQVQRLGAACAREAAELLRHDPLRLGNRGQGRYSLGAAQRTGHLLHAEEWALLADHEAVVPVLDHVFGEGNYVCAGAGGDFVIEGVEGYQDLHRDLNAPGSHDRPEPPVVTVNFTVGPLTWENGPMRIIPGTHRLPPGRFSPPPDREENEDWKLLTLSPLPAGCAIVRDNRTWHAGTPNLSARPRFLPNLEYAARWWCRGATSEHWRCEWLLAPRCMPRDVHARLSARGRQLCSEVVAAGALDCGVRPDLGGGL